jgi:hypothetical protein
MAVYAEESNNIIKANALQQVKGYLAQGGVLYKVEDETSNTFVGVKVILDQQEVFSYYRKKIL